MRMRTWVWMAGCVGVLGCLDSGAADSVDAAPDANVVDAAPDANVPDANVVDAASDADVCGREAAAQADLLTRARAAGCSRNADCTLLGSCDQGFGFVSVPHSFAAETQALIDATECDWFDGPAYDAVCEAGQCVARENGGQCGSQEPPVCANGQLYENPCVTASPNNATIQAGCHTACDPAASTQCPIGTTCRAASVCPVGFPFQAEGCFQCEAITVSLCVPAD